MFWFRIDNRLIHGQVIETWLPYLKTDCLVVANDDVAGDVLQQQIMRLAIPPRVTAVFLSVPAAKPLFERLRLEGRSALFLMADCRDARRLAEAGVPMPTLNVGNLHYASGKRQICPHVAASPEDIECLRAFSHQDTRLDFRCIPGDIPILEDW